MHKLGVISTILGLILSVIGLAVGFFEMLNGDANAEVWLNLVPFGFVGLMVGITMTQLYGKR